VSGACLQGNLRSKSSISIAISAACVSPDSAHTKRNRLDAGGVANWAHSSEMSTGGECG
jgi:hypothetical protein